MATHTPGPWKVTEEYVPSTGPHVYVEAEPDSFGSAVTIAEVIEDPFKNTQPANARLIAAAPELLAALQTAQRTIRTWHGMGMGAHEAQAWALYQASPEMQQITAAIAKAEGR